VMWSVWVVDAGIVSCRVRFPNPSLGRELVGRWHPNKIQSERRPSQTVNTNAASDDPLMPWKLVSWVWS
jgi:hypothetical protein